MKGTVYLSAVVEYSMNVHDVEKTLTHTYRSAKIIIVAVTWYQNVKSVPLTGGDL